MSHLTSKLGDLLHFHPLAHLHEARNASNIPGGPDPVDAQDHPTRPDDLAHLGLKGDRHAPDCCSDLGRFALLSKDDLEHEARVDDIWISVD